jgi:single-stranded DNA-binding protein
MLLLNKVQFTGKISDPVSIRRKGDEPFVRFTLVQNDSIPSRKDEQPREVVTHLHCEMKGKKAITFAENVRKGTHILVEGKLERDPYVSLHLRVSAWHFLLPREPLGQRS